MNEQDKLDQRQERKDHRAELKEARISNPVPSSYKVRCTQVDQAVLLLVEVLKPGERFVLGAEYMIDAVRIEDPK